METTLYDMIQTDIEKDGYLSGHTRNEVSKYIDFKRNRKRLLWLFYSAENQKLYPMNENAVKDLLVNDIESLFKKRGLYKIYNGIAYP